MHQSKKPHITSNKYNPDNKSLAAEMSSDSISVNDTIFSDLNVSFGSAMTAALTSEGDHPAAPIVGPERVHRHTASALRASTTSPTTGRTHLQCMPDLRSRGRPDVV